LAEGLARRPVEEVDDARSVGPDVLVRSRHEDVVPETG
jgi:hypothetical protein